MIIGVLVLVRSGISSIVAILLFDICLLVTDIGGYSSA
jgi:hypothetical protein